MHKLRQRNTCALMSKERKKDIELQAEDNENLIYLPVSTLF